MKNNAIKKLCVEFRKNFHLRKEIPLSENTHIGNITSSIAKLDTKHLNYSNDFLL